MPQQPSARRIPAHVGIIMDGNGRWATSRGLPRTAGHREGTHVAKRIVRAAVELGLGCLSLYVFSTENWKRASEEISFLMGLIKAHLVAELDFYRENKVRVVHSGKAEGLPPEVLAEIRRVEADTRDFTRITVNLAINYGGRDEIVRAVVRAIEARPGLSIDEKALSEAMDRPDLPHPDLVIRTGGEMRLSNFLLWESAYSELYFSPKLWPDFTAEDLAAAIEDYGRRERRFGGIS